MINKKFIKKNYRTFFIKKKLIKNNFAAQKIFHDKQKFINENK